MQFRFLKNASVAALVILFSQAAMAQLGGTPGAFSRMGFGARGMGMGNAMTAVTTGDIVGYYNPALLSWSEYRQATASFGILSLDRRLNFLSYSQPLRPSAGISAGIINAGVTDIDGRDADGEQTGTLMTAEDEIFLSFSNRFKSGFSLGITVKLFYYHLYTDVSTTTVGLDAGFLIPIGKAVTLGFSARDLNSKYRWDTSQLYGQQGSSETWEFPQLYTIGAAYKLPDSLGIVAFDLEVTNKKTIMGRIGVEVPLIPEVTVRAGMDRIDLKEKGSGVKPTFGFTVRKSMSDWTPAVNYAFVVEPFSPTPTHVISLTVIF
ncbi:MAG TPA: hypothetical protein DGH68_03490 [Bacteroidetes bacterium]|jgi:hypothetical protein|nr:hypothetical protein [Bacteroidota bacterium]